MSIIFRRRLSAVDVLISVFENGSAAELSASSSASVPHSPPLSSVQVSPQHQAVAEATDEEGQHIDGGNDGERGGPVTVITVQRRRGG